jgi:hypothetical protein
MITWTLKDVNEVNAVLIALGKLPYEQVVNLIASLQQQAQAQLAAPPPSLERKRIMPT